VRTRCKNIVIAGFLAVCDFTLIIILLFFFFCSTVMHVAALVSAVQRVLVV